VVVAGGLTRIGRIPRKDKRIPFWVVSYDVLDVLPEYGLLGDAMLFITAGNVISLR